MLNKVENSNWHVSISRDNDGMEYTYFSYLKKYYINYYKKDNFRSILTNTEKITVNADLNSPQNVFFSICSINPCILGFCSIL